SAASKSGLARAGSSAASQASPAWSSAPARCTADASFISAASFSKRCAARWKSLSSKYATAMQWSAAQPPPSMRQSWARSRPSLGFSWTCAMQRSWRGDGSSAHCARAGAATSGQLAATPSSSRATLLSRLDDTVIAYPCGRCGDRRFAAEEMPQTLEIEIDHRRNEQGQELGDKQAADHGEAQRAAQLGAGAEADGDRQAAHDRRHGRHHDRAEAQQAGLVDCRLGRDIAGALPVEREVDHHDGVLLDDADQHDHADDGDDAQIHAEEHE